jgi:hypothetical protein
LSPGLRADSDQLPATPSFIDGHWFDPLRETIMVSRKLYVRFRGLDPHIGIYGTSDHSGLRPANFTTLLHFSASSATYFGQSGPRQEFSGCRRLRGGAGRTRTNHQSVMEHGWCPTNSPGRTPIQIAGRFAVLLDFPGFLILEPTTKVLWNMAGVRPTTLVGHPSGLSGVCCFP